MNSIGDGYAGNGATGSWTHLLQDGVNSALLVCVAVRSHAQDGAVLSVACDGVAVGALSTANDGVDCAIGLYVLLSPPSGVHTITVTMTGAARYFCANSVQMFDVVPGSTSVTSHGNGNTMTATDPAGLTGDIDIAMLMQKDIVTTATPEAGGIVLIPPLASSGGSPSNENCSLCVAYQRGYPSGSLTSTYATDITNDYVFHAVQLAKVPNEITCTAILELNASLPSFRHVDGALLAAASQSSPDYDARLRTLERRTEPIRRGTVGR